MLGQCREIAEDGGENQQRHQRAHECPHRIYGYPGREGSGHGDRHHEAGQRPTPGDLGEVHPLTPADHAAARRPVQDVQGAWRYRPSAQSPHITQPGTEVVEIEDPLGVLLGSRVEVVSQMVLPMHIMVQQQDPVQQTTCLAINE